MKSTIKLLPDFVKHHHCINMDTGAMKQSMKKLPDAQYADSMVELFDTYRPPEVQKSLLKRLGRKGKRQAEFTPVLRGVAEGGTPPAWPSSSGKKTKPAGQVSIIRSS